MSSEIFLQGTEALNYSLFEASRSNNTTSLEICTFQQIESLWDIIAIFEQTPCYRHATGYTTFLCLANLIILAFGLVGNSVVIYVVLLKIKTKVASSIFILNLAVADLLVILFCIPATLMANLFMPWVIGNAMCKAVAYGQGVSVFSSVYSLVAITFDRFRAIHHSLGLTPNMSVSQAQKIVILIWIVGLVITFPWVSVFTVVYMNPYKHESLHSDLLAHISLPFCQEVWESETQGNLYFVIVHVFACFLLPLCMITVCNIVIWRNVLSTAAGVQTNSATSSLASSTFPTSSRTCLQETQREKKIRILKMFTGLTFVFFIFWLPLYGIMARVKFFYTEDYRGSALEQRLVPQLIPAAQLLGSCNSCVNPVLYALLNQTFRDSFISIFKRPWCFGKANSNLGTPRQEHNSMVVMVAAPVEVDRCADSAV